MSPSAFAASANFNVPYSQELTIDPATGQLIWRDSSLDVLSFGYLINSKTAIAVDSMSSTAPVLV